MRKIFFILVILYFIQCQNRHISMYQTTFFAYDTVVTISIEKQKNYKKFLKTIKNIIKKYDLIFNIHNKKSKVYKIKTLPLYKRIKLNSELYYVLKTAQKIYTQSNGLFDPTIGIISEKYNFNMKSHSPPNIKKYINFVGLTNIILTNHSIILKKSGLVLDLGGISKGYIIDQISDYLIQHNFNNFLINIGGDIYAHGLNSNDKKWVIGIQHPAKKNGIIFKKKLSNMAIATSGDYERYFFYNGKKYFHILNPFTGLPAFGNIKSVTVISKKAVLADALSTTIFLLGEKKANLFIQKYYPGVKYFIIKSDLTIISN